MSRVLALVVLLGATTAHAAPGAAVKARVGWSALGTVDSIQADGGGLGLGQAMQPVHGALGGFVTLSPRMQLGVMAGYGRFLEHDAAGTRTTALSILPTLRLLSDMEGLGAYGEFGLGYSYLNQSGTDVVESHGWQTQLEGGLTLMIADGLRAELGVAFAFRMGGNSTDAGPAGTAALGFDAPDLRLGLSYEL